MCSYMYFCAQIGRNFVNNFRIENFSKKSLRKDEVNILYTYDITGWSKSLCAPDFCTVKITCTETSWSPCTCSRVSAIITEIVNRYVHFLPCLKKRLFDLRTHKRKIFLTSIWILPEYILFFFLKVNTSIYRRIPRLKNTSLSIKYTNFDSHLSTSNERMSVFKWRQ
jgi:hypothetical protein